MSSGVCVAEAPEAFGFGPDGFAVTLPGASAATDEQLDEIASLCPTGAIVLERRVAG
jgi:ferredoxin